MSDGTKMSRDCVLSWRKIFSLTMNLLLLVLPPLITLTLANEVIAQATSNQQNLQQAANDTNQIPADLEPAILTEINRVRTNPQGYAQWLEEQRQYYDGIWLRLPGEKPVRTNKGRKALEEAIAFLKEQQPLPPLQTSEQTADKAMSELENFATANNIQFFSYGRKTASGIVMGLVVDDLFPDRRRRQSLLSSNAEDTGVVCKPDPRYAKVCAIAYSDSPTTNLATSSPESEATSEATPTSNTVANVPEIIVPPVTQTNTETPNTTAKDQAEAEITTTTPENLENENLEDSDLAALPVPPVPQAPPQSAENSETEPPQGTAADLELKDPENQQTAPAATDTETKVAEVEPEQEEAPVASDADQSEAEANTAETEASKPTDNQETELETEAQSEQVAAKPESDRLLTKVERGSLEKGDRIIAEDGSLYDFYPLEGKAGESFTIYLESDEFDSFVALVDSNGNTIKENDDISEENSNSRIRVTLPEDGTYNIIVNTYDEQGTGKYVLTLSR
ncbi:MAG: pre-peptidase C-terminal domain-containing protein [Cyanobacteria bacterium J06638_38]